MNRTPSGGSWTSMSSDFRTLTVSRSADGFVVTVELNRPEALNAMNTAMGEDFLRCFDAFQWDRTGGAVSRTGAGAGRRLRGAGGRARDLPGHRRPPAPAAYHRRAAGQGDDLHRPARERR